MAMLEWINRNHSLFDSSNSGIQETYLMGDMNVSISSNKTLRDKGILKLHTCFQGQVGD